MALIQVGRVLVDPDEFASEEKGFLSKPAGFKFSTGSPREIPKFKEIGIGKPLIIAIEHIYPGRLPRVGPLRKKPDVLVTSSTKAFHVIDAATRAINALVRNVEDHKPFAFHAMTEGTRIVYYRDAMVDESTDVSVEIVGDLFPDEAFNQIANALNAAAGLPVFAPASLYLMGGSMLVRALGKLGERLADGRPFFVDSLPIRFDTAGWEIAQPRKALLQPQGTTSEFADYEFAEGSFELMSKTTKAPYHGDIPYVALRVDGRSDPTLSSFASRALTTAVLNRFFHLDQSGSAILEAMGTALELYSDLSFAKRAREVAGTLATTKPDDPEHKKLQELLNALLKNIRHDELKPKQL